MATLPVPSPMLKANDGDEKEKPGRRLPVVAANESARTARDCPVTDVTVLRGVAGAEAVVRYIDSMCSLRFPYVA
jgi:hypothetical protein